MDCNDWSIYYFCYRADYDAHITTQVISHLIPGIEQHDVVLAEVVLSELSHLRDDEAARLIGALEQARLVVHEGLLQPEV